MCYVHNEWYDIFCATLYLFWFVEFVFLWYIILKIDDLASLSIFNQLQMV